MVDAGIETYWIGADRVSYYWIHKDGFGAERWPAYSFTPIFQISRRINSFTIVCSVCRGPCAGASAAPWFLCDPKYPLSVMCILIWDSSGCLLAAQNRALHSSNNVSCAHKFCRSLACFADKVVFLLFLQVLSHLPALLVKTNGSKIICT